jgi:hypothetical protein
LEWLLRDVAWSPESGAKTGSKQGTLFEEPADPSPEFLRELLRSLHEVAWSEWAPASFRRAAREHIEAIDKELAALDAASDIAFGLTRVERERLAAKRPTRYREGVVEKVWENAKDTNGKVFDPNTGEELHWDRSRNRDDQWDMGHKKNKSYDQLKNDFIEGRISRQKFLDEYNNPENYRPEAVPANRSRRYQ